MILKILKDKRNFLMVVMLISIIFIQYNLKNGIVPKTKYYNEMYIASRKMEKLLVEVKKEKLKRGFEIDSNIDKNSTGLIGLEWSEISTTLGDEVAKRTSTNTDFAALITKKIKELDLGQGDRVAVNMSSSFPALNLAVISALDTLGLEGVIVNTVGSSSYGANIKDFTYLDMEKHLYNSGLIKNTSIAYSFGGIDDVAKEFEQEVIEEIKNRNRKYNLILFYNSFYNSNLEENIEQRYKFYQERGEIKLFINIGGNSLAFGKSYKDIENSDLILQKKLQIRDGLVGKFYSSGVPVIHLLNIKGIALKNKIPIDSVEKSEIGTGAVFFEDINSMKYNLIIIILVLIFFVYNAKIMKKFEVKS